jgi:hypothetical protein
MTLGTSLISLKETSYDIPETRKLVNSTNSRFNEN